jgi:hypothetical protein
VNIGGLDAGVDETVFVEKIERGEDGGQHATGFVRREGATRQKLAEIFVGTFGDDVEAGRAVNSAAAKMVDAKKSRMRKSSGGAPMIELKIAGGRIFGDEFYGCVGGRIAGARRFVGGEENRGVLRDAEKFAEREAAVRELAQKMLCCC